MSISAELEQSAPLQAVRSVLSSEETEGWIVGGTVRDLLMGTDIDDIDIVVSSATDRVAKGVADRISGDVFSLSDKFGTWRVIAPDRSWQADLSPVNEGGIEADLHQRDFTVNAMAIPIGGGDVIDPVDGAKDLEDRLLRVVSEDAYHNDPLRVMRLARISCEYGFKPELESVAAAGRCSEGLQRVSGERVFYELSRLVTSDGVLEGLELLDNVGAMQVVIPELSALKGIGQTPYHHLDAHDHTIEVLKQLIRLERDDSELGPAAGAVSKLMAEPLADELSYRQSLRFGALFHDLGKSKTHAQRDDGRVTFMGHDREGKIMAADICARLRTSGRLSRYLQDLTLHHLRLGFMVHDRPLSRSQAYSYIKVCEPVALEVTVFSIADRLATRGDRTKQKAIDDHVELAREMIGYVLEWRDQHPRTPLVSGDELMAELSIKPGPVVGKLLDILDEAQYLEEIKSKKEALNLAKAKHGVIDAGGEGS